MTSATGKSAFIPLHPKNLIFQNGNGKHYLKWGVTGFTFIELILVITIIGILIGVAVPNIGKSYNNFLLTSSASELQTLMQFLRERAIAENQAIYLSIDTDTNAYRSFTVEPETLLKSRPYSKRINIETDKNKIIFYPDGQIEKVTIKLLNQNMESITLTTQGVFGNVKIIKNE